MMEPVFIAAVIMVGALVTTSYFVTNGVGTMGAPLRQLALFLMNKAPVGLVDLFKDNPGSGSRTWMKYGIVWFLLALVSGFLGIWHNYDPSALDSLASIGWSYDDGSALADFTASTFNLAFTYLVVGGCLVAVSRSANNRLASEANASMVAVLYTASMAFSLILIPIIFNFTDIADEENIRDLISTMVNYVVSSLLFAALLMNVLATYSTRGEGTSSVSAWFLIMAIVSKLIASIYHLIGEASDTTQLVWMSDRILESWVPLALIFALAYHVIPYATKTPIWSGSLLNASMVLLFITVPPFFMDSADAGDFLQNIGALLMTFALLPILATSFNLIATASSNSSGVLKNPGAFSASMAMVLMPIFAIGSYFTGMDTFTGTDKMGTMAATIDNGFMYTVGGLMMLSAVFTSYPLASGNKLSEPSRANLATWFFVVGGLASTITMLIGDFTEKAVKESGVEDIVASNSGFYLVAAALFYLLPIGAILATLVLIRTGTSSHKIEEIGTQSSDIDTYTMVEGTTTSIQELLGRGVGVNTRLVVGESHEDDGGSTIIAVSASLHNDEVTEFPEEEVEEDEATEEESKGPAKELVMLLDYLKQSDQTVFEFFRSIDLDDSGSIDCYEFQQALAKTDAGEYPPWEIESLVAAIDLDKDGKINLPELDISLARIASQMLPDETDSETQEAEESDSTPSESELKKMKKAELVELAENLGVSADGTKSDIIDAILNA